jgi:hypothetical protein
MGSKIPFVLRKDSSDIWHQDKASYTGSVTNLWSPSLMGGSYGQFNLLHVAPFISSTAEATAFDSA